MPNSPTSTTSSASSGRRRIGRTKGVRACHHACSRRSRRGEAPARACSGAVVAEVSSPRCRHRGVVADPRAASPHPTCSRERATITRRTLPSRCCAARDSEGIEHLAAVIAATSALLSVSTSGRARSSERIAGEARRALVRGARRPSPAGADRPASSHRLGGPIAGHAGHPAASNAFEVARVAADASDTC